MDLYTELEVFRVAVLVGVYSKEDLIKYLDQLIDELDDVPYEIIEASMGKKTDDILMIIKDFIYTYKVDESVVLGSLIKLIEKMYKEKSITIFEGIYYLDNLKEYVKLDEYDMEFIMYLSDGYYLATEGIYGEINKIEIDFNIFMSHLVYMYSGQ